VHNIELLCYVIKDTKIQARIQWAAEPAYAPCPPNLPQTIYLSERCCTVVSWVAGGEEQKEYGNNRSGKAELLWLLKSATQIENEKRAQLTSHMHDASASNSRTFRLTSQ